MPKLLLLEEYHVAVRVPAKIPDNESKVIRRLLAGKAFRAQLRETLEELFARYAALARTRLAITR